MSAFLPLNLVEDVSASKKDLEEEHTRELEIENAYKTYQEAISLQSKKQWVDAYVKYKELAKSTVVVSHFFEETSIIKGFQNGASNLQPDELAFIPQNVKKIRFLYFRNRGFLHYNILKAGSGPFAGIFKYEVSEDPDLTRFELKRDLFYTMLDGFVNCLVYEEADECLLRILYDIYTFLDVRRLAKFTLEYCISAPEESDEAANVSGFNDWVYPVWGQFKRSGFLKNGDIAQISKKLSFLKPLKADLEAQMRDKTYFNTLTVLLKPHSSWLDVIHSLNNSIRDNQDKDKLQELPKITCKYVDPYLVSENAFDDISFTFSEEESRDMEPDTDVSAVEPPSADSFAENDPKDSKEPKEIKDDGYVQVPEPPYLDGHVEKANMRLSKRLNPGGLTPVETDDIQLIRPYFVETEFFFTSLNDSLNAIFDMEQPVLSDMVCHIVSTEEAANNTSPAYIHVFLKTLNEWKPQVYDPLLFPEKNSDTKRKSQSDKKRLIDVLTSFGNQFSNSTNDFRDLGELQDPAYIRNFLNKRFSRRCHVHQAKLEVVLHLMATITTTVWGDQLFACVSDWAMLLEPAYYQTCEQAFDRTGSVDNIRLVIGIFEVLINAYILTKEKLEHLLESGAHTIFVKSVKSNYNVAAIELLRVSDRIEKWTRFLERFFIQKRSNDEDWKAEMEFIVRFYWASNYYVAAQSFLWRNKTYVVVHLHKLADVLTGVPLSNDLHIAYPNYAKLGEFSLEGLNRRLSTASILLIFLKILDQSDSEISSTTETILLLESILFGEDALAGEDLETSILVSSGEPGNGSLVSSVINGLAVLDRVSLSSVKQFFYECPIDLKLSLWNILFLYYQSDSFSNFQRGLEHYLRFILGFLGSPSYEHFDGDKPVLLLSLVASYRNHVATLLKHLSENKWLLPYKGINLRQVSDIARVFELCYTFSLHEEAAFYTSRKVSLATKSEASFEFFKDFFIDAITLLLAYCFNYISAQNMAPKDPLVSRFLALVHYQLGLRHLCDSSKGLFLKFAEDSLVSLSDTPETELTQILSCRYHYKVKLYGQFPADHYTVKSAELNKQSAEGLAIFILPLCFRTNPLTQTPRNDLKQVVDDLFEIIGDPDVDSDRTLSGNKVTIENFIDKSAVGARFIKESFYGLVSLEMRPPEQPNKVASEGLYFVEAVLMFNAYKIRKKSAQSRVVELERIITILIFDLIYGSDRVESWILLAQAYGYIVEDDLIWTSDKISSVERKMPTANVQRKALVCYLMAISTFTRPKSTVSEAFKPLLNVLMNSFAKELYSSAKMPMDMIAYQVHNTSKFVRQHDQTFFLKMTEKPGVSRKSCLALINRCLEMAVRANPEDWNSLYYLGKVKAKLNHAPTEVLDVLVRSNTAARKQSVTSDPILEPAYKHLSLLYKYVKSGGLSVEAGVQYLQIITTLSTILEYTPKTQTEFFNSILICLKRLLLLDKRGWYHKPAYRQAMITYYEFQNPTAAKEILAKYFTLKSNNKTFLQLWKPENERPGKHFVYMYQYTRFYITILGCVQDFTAMALMYPKLRRANSTMTLLNVVWEQLCTQICTLTRKILDIDSFHVRLFLASTTFSTFVAQAQKVVASFKSDTASDRLQKHLCLLHVITDIRKLNNGFGPTALIDYTFTGIFIQIFREVLVSNEEISDTCIPDSPNGKAKKLAKRDLFPFTTDVATKCKRDTELFLKLHPEIFNLYVADFEKNAEIARRIKAEEEQRQLFVLQLKFLRLFAEQLLLRDQRKAMYRMLAHVVPRRCSCDVGGCSQMPTPTAPFQISMNLCGPEAIAATFSAARRYARAPGNADDVSAGHRDWIQGVSSGPDPALGGVLSYGPYTGSQPYQGHPGHMPDYGYVSQPPLYEGDPAQYQDNTPVQRHLSNGAGEYGTGRGNLTNRTVSNRNVLDVARTGGSSPNIVALQRLEMEVATSSGSFDDPVEIESDEGVTPEAEQKRSIDTVETAEERETKRVKDK